MKELDGKSCLYEKSKYVCGILKVKACNKCKFRAVNTQENYQKKIVEVIVEDNDGIHYLELDDEYDEVNVDNYKKLLKDGEDTIFETYQDLYRGIVEYNIYDDLQNGKKYGYTIDNFYLDKTDLDNLGIKVILQLDYESERDDMEEMS